MQNLEVSRASPKLLLLSGVQNIVEICFSPSCPCRLILCVWGLRSLKNHNVDFFYLDMQPLLSGWRSVWAWPAVIANGCSDYIVEWGRGCVLLFVFVNAIGWLLPVWSSQFCFPWRDLGLSGWIRYTKQTNKQINSQPIDGTEHSQFHLSHKLDWDPVLIRG